MVSTAGKLIPVGIIAAALAVVLAIALVRASREATVRRRYKRRREPGAPLCELYEANEPTDSLVREACEPPSSRPDRAERSPRSRGGHPDPRWCAERWSRGAATRGRRAAKGIPVPDIQKVVAECGESLYKHLFWIDTIAMKWSVPSDARDATEAILYASQEAMRVMSPNDIDYVIVSCEGIGSAMYNRAGLASRMKVMELTTAHRARTTGGKGGHPMRFLASFGCPRSPCSCATGGGDSVRRRHAVRWPVPGAQNGGGRGRGNRAAGDRGEGEWPKRRWQLRAPSQKRKGNQATI